MIYSTIAKIKGFLLNPVGTFQQTKDDEPKGVFTYFAVLVFIFSFLFAIFGAIGVNTFIGVFTAGISIFLIFIVLFIWMGIATLIFAAWLHLWVYIFGGRNGIMQTMKTIVYGSTPAFLLGWIPFIGIFFSIWSLILGILGLRELQGLSLERSAAACVIAVVVPIILLVFLALFFFISLIAMSGMDPVVLGAPFNAI